MKLYMTLFALIFALFCTSSLSGQNKPCNNFDCAYKKAKTFLKQAAYQKALDNLDSAEGYLTDTNTKEKEQIKQLRRRHCLKLRGMMYFCKKDKTQMK